MAPPPSQDHNPHTRPVHFPPQNPNLPAPLANFIPTTASTQSTSTITFLDDPRYTTYPSTSLTNGRITSPLNLTLLLSYDCLNFLLLTLLIIHSVRKLRIRRRHNRYLRAQALERERRTHAQQEEDDERHRQGLMTNREEIDAMVRDMFERYEEGRRWRGTDGRVREGAPAWLVREQEWQDRHNARRGLTIINASRD